MIAFKVKEVPSGLIEIKIGSNILRSLGRSFIQYNEMLLTREEVKKLRHLLSKFDTMKPLQ